MIEHLFVYGTLAPGQPNGHLLADLPGIWRPASTRGELTQLERGAAVGYFAIRLDERASDVHGLVFSSQALTAFWSQLDEFEGESYRRVLTRVQLEDGHRIDAYVYEINQD